MQQPEIILHQGHEYSLHSPVKTVSTSPLVTEGPFYARTGVDPADWAYLPDSRFLAGQTDQPAFMHCIQQRQAPLTPRPTA